MSYTAKVPHIINYTLTDANTWYLISSTIDAPTRSTLRRWRMKARENTDNSFDYDYTSGHSTYMTNGGQGVNFDNCAMPDIYCRSSTAGTVIELEYWE
ncbi:hypothetical protein M0R04_11935 [Candidatus Dojkabacteria bacterium]|jgi:hypothetical protein|nr:hypothetical protein [Candidatus Dojkabacteria bacterium]